MNLCSYKFIYDLVIHVKYNLSSTIVLWLLLFFEVKILYIVLSHAHSSLIEFLILFFTLSKPFEVLQVKSLSLCSTSGLAKQSLFVHPIHLF